LLLHRRPQTPLFALHSEYDQWSLNNILSLPCVPSLNNATVDGYPSCSPPQLQAMQSWRDLQVATVAAAVAGRPGTGVYLDACFVHEQLVDYCSSQPLPNCVGWAEFTVTVPGGGPAMANATIRDAIGAWYDWTMAHWEGVVDARRLPGSGARGGVAAAGEGERPPAATAAVTANASSFMFIDPLYYPNNPSCPFPTPTAVPPRVVRASFKFSSSASAAYAVRRL
jgi:hypothetical protein